LVQADCEALRCSAVWSLVIDTRYYLCLLCAGCSHGCRPRGSRWTTWIFIHGTDI